MSTVTQEKEAQINAAPASEDIRAILDMDPVWAAYAVADLQPDYAPYCRWRIAETDTGKGLTLLFTRLSLPTLFTMGDTGEVAEALERTAMPETVYITIREEHFRLASRYYDFSTDTRPMWRMTLTDPAAAMTEMRLPDGLQVTPLSAGDSERIRRLHAIGGPYAPDAFEPYQTAGGTFFGVENGSGELLAAGGTHVVDWQAGVGGIGNMYTHPARRGEGLGTAVLRAIVEKLVAGGATNIVLNVDQHNLGARRLYERHGFEVYCPYLEGIGHRRSY